MGRILPSKDYRHCKSESAGKVLIVGYWSRFGLWDFFCGR